MPTTNINNSPNANLSTPTPIAPASSAPQPTVPVGEIPTLNPALVSTGLPTLGQSLLISTAPSPAVPTPAPAAALSQTLPTTAPVVPPSSPAPVATPTPSTPLVPPAPAPAPASPIAPTPTPATVPTHPVGLATPSVGTPPTAAPPATASVPTPGLPPTPTPTPMSVPAVSSTPAPAPAPAATPAPVGPVSAPSVPPMPGTGTGTNTSGSVPPVIPSVAPTAPGAEPKPVTPIAETPAAKPEKKTDLTMIILAVVLVILVVVAGVLWWMNANGKSLFGGQVATVVTPEPVVAPITTPEPVADASPGGSREELVAIDVDDLCYVNPDSLGQQKDVEEFVTWVNNYFTDDLENSEYYQNLFNYYMERAIMAPPLCDSHQLYCRAAFSERPDFVAQFSHFGEQWERQTTESKTLTGQSIRDRALIDFNMPDLVLDENTGRGSLAGNGWKYNADQDILLSFGEYTLPQQDYTYRFVKGMQLAATQEVVLIGQGVATQNCKEENNCVCEASQIYLYLQKGPTGELYYSNLFIEPLVGKTAEVDADL